MREEKMKTVLVSELDGTLHNSEKNTTILC